MLELLKKIIALVPVGHELYNAIAELLKELCGRVEASETSARETREMLLARADQIGELTTRLAQLESSDRIPQLANEIKDVRIDAIEQQVAALASRVEGFDPEVKFVRVERPDDAPPAAAAANDAAPELALEQAPCPEHPDAPMTPNGCTGEGCTWSGIDRAA